MHARSPARMLVTPVLRAEFANKVSTAITMEVHTENSNKRKAVARPLARGIAKLLARGGAIGGVLKPAIDRSYGTAIGQALERKRRLRRRRSGARRHAKSLHDELKGVLAADAELKSA